MQPSKQLVDIATQARKLARWPACVLKGNITALGSDIIVYSLALRVCGTR